MDDTDRKHLERCIELAEQAMTLGNFPFGSILVAGSGEVLFEDYNREISDNDATLHPEFEAARWAARNLLPAERAGATVYTSGEHCPMCSAAHGWAGLGRIVYAGSAAQLSEWRGELSSPPPPVAPLPISAIVPGVAVEGPEPSLAERLRDMHHRSAARG